MSYLGHVRRRLREEYDILRKRGENIKKSNCDGVIEVDKS